MDGSGGNPRYAGSLRSALTARLIDLGALRSGPIVAAFRTVPRHVFVPNVPPEVAYIDDVVLMKSDAIGAAISTVSQPAVVAMMLEQAAIEPGARVLEIGSGGYNAALMSELAGPHGSVTTLDIDPDVTERARRTLTEAGYSPVRVVRADGEFGCPESAPYDLILITVTAGDIAPAWFDQLGADGRLVVPLRLRGQTRSIAFDKTGDHLTGRSDVVCGFVSMQGVGANQERVLRLYEDKVILRADEDQPIDIEPLDGVLQKPQTVEWSGILLDRNETFSNLDLWLACNFPEYCVLSVKRSAIKSGLVSPALRWGGSAAVEDETLGYLSSRPGPAKHLVELGARAHGPTAPTLAANLVAQVRAWDKEYRHGRGPTFTAHPRSTPADELPGGTHITTRHTQLTISWP